MQLVDGQSLDKRIPEGGMPVESLRSIATALAEALAAAHEKGVVHREPRRSCATRPSRRLSGGRVLSRVAATLPVLGDAEDLASWRREQALAEQLHQPLRVPLLESTAPEPQARARYSAGATWYCSILPSGSTRTVTTTLFSASPTR